VVLAIAYVPFAFCTAELTALQQSGFAMPAYDYRGYGHS